MFLIPTKFNHTRAASDSFQQGKQRKKGRITVCNSTLNLQPKQLFPAANPPKELCKKGNMDLQMAERFGS